MEACIVAYKFNVHNTISFHIWSYYTTLQIMRHQGFRKACFSEVFGEAGMLGSHCVRFVIIVLMGI